MWSHQRTGSGRPLVLLHGIGMSRAAWEAVTPHLRHEREVISFDIPGFGATPPLAAGIPPTLGNLVEALETSLREMKVQLPVDIAGSSLGGSLALKAARRAVARTAVAISPPGLWRQRPPCHVKYVFAAVRFMARTVPGLLKMALRAAPLRELALAVPLSVGSRRMPAADAMRAVEDLAASSGFDATFQSTRAPFSGAGIRVPVTVVFGDHDWILPVRSRCRDALPSHAVWLREPAWGHVPMWADPIGVARLILEHTS
jgi:pimeloyl-ACP methyl ester carboxylesterase